MVDIQVAEGMTDAQKSACDIASQMSDEKRTRMMNLLTKQWGSQPLAIKEIPEKTLSWDRAIKPDDRNAFDLTDPVASQLDTLIRFEN